jgi:hypothetical protein
VFKVCMLDVGVHYRVRMGMLTLVIMHQPTPGAVVGLSVPMHLCW